MPAPPLRTTAPTPYFHPLFWFFRFPCPFWGRSLKFTSPPGGSELCRAFKAAIWKWKPNNWPCRLCKTNNGNVGFIQVTCSELTKDARCSALTIKTSEYRPGVFIVDLLTYWLVDFIVDYYWCLYCWRTSHLVFGVWSFNCWLWTYISLMALSSPNVFTYIYIYIYIYI